MKVAVVIPAFNAQATIGAAIESAWRQTEPPDEVIVGNDASTDATSQLASAAGARVLDLPKGNANTARNAAIDATDADIVLLLDADDTFAPGKVAAHRQAHASSAVPLVFDPCRWCSPSGEIGEMVAKVADGPIPYAAFTSRSHWYGGSSYSVRKKAWEKAGGFREVLTSQQDVDFWIRVTHVCGAARCLPESHSFFHQTAGSTSRHPRRVLENLQILIEGLPFLTRAEQRRLWSHVIFTCVDNVPLGTGLPFLATALDRAFDPRFAKSVARSLRKTWEIRRFTLPTTP
jgi:glycosyltransferase involved in cell wall biosynthesis